ncbi:MAG: hypothetical protein Kow00107_10900 [Planctomycetota bacterium]
MAVLGQFVAGIAHELNNPAGALQRGSHQLEESISNLIGATLEIPHNDFAAVRKLGRDLFTAAVANHPKPLSEIRKLTKEFEKLLPKSNLRHDYARMLAEVHAPFETIKELLSELKDKEQSVIVLHRYHQIGLGLHHINIASSRVESLVAGLRSYARPDSGEPHSFSIRESLENTLAIVGHLTRGIKVVRDFDNAPTAFGQPGPINQVWTNLIANAAESLAGRGTLRISAMDGPEGFVRVDIADDGPGIPPDCIDKIWELNFTTKKGPNSFGLGLGLAISRSIVEGQGGSISVSSKPGETVFTVLLPKAAG